MQWEIRPSSEGSFRGRMWALWNCFSSASFRAGHCLKKQNFSVLFVMPTVGLSLTEEDRWTLKQVSFVVLYLAEKYCLLSVCLLLLQGLCQQKHGPCSPSPEGPGALRGACPAAPASSQLGPVQHPAASFPCRIGLFFPQNSVSVFVTQLEWFCFKGIIILLVGAVLSAREQIS